jgi:hypothetical protein
MAPLERDRIIDLLMGMRPPVRCAGMAVGGLLAVTAWPDTPASLLLSPTKELWPDVMTHREEVLREFPNSRVLFSVEGEDPVVLATQEFFAWQDHYAIIGVNASWAWDDDDPLARKHGATARLHLSRTLPQTV